VKKHRSTGIGIGIAFVLGLGLSTLGCVEDPVDEFAYSASVPKKEDDEAKDEGELKEAPPSKRGPASSTSGAPDRAPSSSSGSTPTTEATTEWQGVLSSTKTVQFGGSGYCEYRMRLTNVRVNVTMSSRGGVVAASITGNAIEETPSCAQALIPPNLHSYSRPSQASATGPIAVLPAKSNAPQARATVDVNVDNPSAPRAIIRIQRDDGNPPPLTWVINESVPLTKK
jgi:hypothetical protein